ncbi:MAG: asparagine synthase (glutamine-hydrolyzing) [Candidatus Omnitrophica bacterium]|nr:asparagine synthase (glutamine-hydrolyzing) [Candidatus Omnitrophota bacterium]
MCGICGIIKYNAGEGVDRPVLEKMRDAMRHRGPDDAGIFINNGDKVSLGLGHRRLSIIDLSSTGHQPMSNESGTVWTVFNGEIYNYRELRAALEKKGYRFRSQSDTESLLYLYEEYGEDCVRYLRGMFAFAIWDNSRRQLLLARDRLGKKPLLYYNKNGRFCFASEFRSILESGMITREVNYEAINYYLTFGYIPSPLTVYKDVFKLPPAHILTLRDNDMRIKRYWQLDYSEKISISEEDAQDEVIRLLREAVDIRLRSDVPLGAFLSGGIDSSTVVALMSQLSDRKVKTFSVGFEEGDYDELKYARRIAERFSTDHNEFIVKPKALDVLPLLVERYGEPYADSSCIPTYYVSRDTRQYVTVALSGDGGDESFAGYERYQAMLAAQAYQAMPGAVKYAVGAVAAFLPDSLSHKNKIRRIRRFLDAAPLSAGRRYLRWVSVFDDGLKKTTCSDDFLNMVRTDNPIKLIESYIGGANSAGFIDRLLMADVNTYLPEDLLVKMDIASMANSLEARSPFLDHKLMEFAAKLPEQYKIRRFTKKYILKKAIGGVIPRENIHRSKMGFGLPVGKWFRGELKRFLKETLLSPSSFKRGYFRPEAIKDMVDAHINQKKDYAFQLWSLLMLELWHRQFID